MASLKDKFIEGAVANGDARRGRAPALGRHGEGAGLLVQQVARRLLRADRLPHRVAARQPPVRVHGRADLVGDEHEGPRPVLRQRLPRARDRGASARRERVADRLRGRRRQDPLRPQRREGRRRARVPHDHPRARGGRPVRVDLGLHRARRPVGREQARARVARQVRRAAGLAPRHARRARAGARRTARSQQADRLAGQGSIFDLGDGGGVADAAPRTTRRCRPRSSRRTSCCGSRRRRSASTSPSTRSRRSAASCARRPTRRSRSSSAAATARTSPSAGSSARCRHLTTKRGEPMVFLRLDDVTGGIECVVFNSTYAAASELCVPDRILIVKGRVDHKEGETKLVAQRGLRVRVGRDQARGAAADRRDAGARRRGRRARAADPRLPRREPGPRRLPHLGRAEAARARAEVPRRAGARLLRRGARAPRRVGARLRIGRCAGSRSWRSPRSRSRPRRRPRRAPAFRARSSTVLDGPLAGQDVYVGSSGAGVDPRRGDPPQGRPGRRRLRRAARRRHGRRQGRAVRRLRLGPRCAAHQAARLRAQPRERDHRGGALGPVARGDAADRAALGADPLRHARDRAHARRGRRGREERRPLLGHRREHPPPPRPRAHDRREGEEGGAGEQDADRRRSGPRGSASSRTPSRSSAARSR